MALSTLVGYLVPPVPLPADEEERLRRDIYFDPKREPDITAPTYIEVHVCDECGALYAPSAMPSHYHPREDY